MPSNFRNLMNKFWGVRPTAAPSSATPAPTTPKTGQDYLNELDKILQVNEQKLQSFINGIDLRIIKRNMADISFLKPTQNIRRKKKKDDKLPFDVNKPVDFVNNPPTRKDGLPISSIVENTSHLEWRKRAEKLKDVIQGTLKDLENFLTNMARTSGYNPPKTDLGSLTTDLAKNKFPGIDRQTVLEIIKKLRTFRSTYGELILWLQFFQRTEKAKIKANKKKI